MKITSKGLIIVLFTVIGLSFIACSEAKNDSPPTNNAGPVINTNPSLPALTGTVSIIGDAEVEEILTVNTDLLEGSGTISYEWKRGGTVIGTDRNYIVKTADIGSTITVTVTRSGYSGSVTSLPTAVVTAELPPTPGLAYMLMGNAYSVSRGTATAANVVIPTLHEGKPVTMIESNGFSSYTNMTSIRIPDRVTSIGSNAFYNCTSLTSVTIPDSVTSIGNNVLTGCNSLTSVTVPFLGSTLGSTSHIGYIFGASSYSGQNSFIPSSLKTVIITSGNSISSNAFNGCTGLTSIIVPGGTGASSGWSVTIPTSVTSIDAYAFQNCTGLMSITISDRVTDIGWSAFSGCTRLTSITILDSVMSIGQSAFSGCTGLTNITIPDSVTSIGQSAFSGCTGLTNITIPFVGTALNGTSNTNFGYIFGASSYSGQNSFIPSSLKTVIITSGNSISRNAFNGCTGLTSIIVPGGTGASSGWSVTIPTSVTSIDTEAFQNCYGLMSVTISDRVDHIGWGAFSGCTRLTSITIPDSVTDILPNAFSGCTGLTSINFNATALNDPMNGSSNNIFTKAGQNADGITLNIGANVTKIPRYLFGGYTTENRPKITTVNFAERSVCQSIEEYTFSGCTALTSITIPDSVTSIGYYAFSGCASLTSVTFQGTIASSGFDNYITFPGDLRNKFYATDSSYGTPGTYTRESSSSSWTRQE